MVIGPHTRVRRRRGGMLVGGVLAVMLGLGCVALGAGSSWSRWSRVDAPAATPTVDPRLIVVPRTAPIQGALSGGVRLRGTLSPAIPGPNTLRLWASNGVGARIGVAGCALS